MPLPLRHSASEQLKNDHCACARMRDMRLDESWTGSNLGPPQRQTGKRQPYCDVTTIRQTRHFRFWRRQISSWRRRRSRQTSSVFFFSRSTSALALAYFAIKYTHRTIVLLWYNGLCDIRALFMYDACQCMWHIAPIRFNNVH